MPRLMAETPGKKLFSAVGSATQLDKAAAMKAAGAEFLTVGVGDLLVPDKSEAEFEKSWRQNHRFWQRRRAENP